jgi:hypothetical protein
MGRSAIGADLRRRLACPAADGGQDRVAIRADRGQLRLCDALWQRIDRREKGSGHCIPRMPSS